MITLTRLKDYLSIVKDSLAIVAIVIGAVWAIFNFIVLSPDKIAQLNLEKLKNETAFQPVMELSVSARTWKSGTGDYLIEATAKITNVGNFRDELDLSQKPFRFYTVVFDQFLPQPVEPWLESNIEFPLKTTSATVLPRETLRYRLLYKAPVPGIYYVEFVVPLSKKSLEQWQQKNRVDSNAYFEWVDGVYIEIAK